MDFPHWFKPRHDVAGILCTSQEDVDALIAMGWPDKQCPLPGALVEAEETAEAVEETAAEPIKRGPGRPRKGA